MDEAALLERLRQTFREELEDHLETFANESARLISPELSEEDVRECVLSIYRAAHTLKGAAHAVQMREIEGICHSLESAIGDVRSGQISVSPSVLHSLTQKTLEAIRSSSRGQDASPSEVALRTHTAVPVSSVSEMAAPGPSPALPRMPPDDALSSRSPAQRSEHELVTERALESGPPRATSVRIAAARLDDLLLAADATLALCLRIGREDRSIDDVLAQALSALQDLRATPGSIRTFPAPAAIDTLARTLRLVALRERDRRANERVEEEQLRRCARDLVSRARALGLMTLDDLALVLEHAALEDAHRLGKRVSFAFRGRETEADRRQAEQLRAPLLHLVRNAVDHGIEPPEVRRQRGKPPEGRLTVTVSLRGPRLELVVEDDGAGLDSRGLRAAAGLPEDSDADVFELASRPGITTRAEPSETSGRGIGLDAVRHAVSSMGGRIRHVTSGEPGARFEITVPVDKSVVSAIVFRLRDVQFALPADSVMRLFRVHPKNQENIEGKLYVRTARGRALLADMHRTLGFPPERIEQAGQAVPTIVLDRGDRQAAFMVSEVKELLEVVVKPFPHRLRRVPFTHAVAVLPNGRLAPLLDADALVLAAEPDRWDPDGRNDAVLKRDRVLVVDDSVTTRQLVRSILESAGFHVTVAVDGADALTKLESTEFDLLVSDLEMPRVDGFELLRLVRGRGLAMPVVLVTALENEADRARALDLGADAYVVKSSFDQTDLFTTIEGLLR